MCFSSGSFEHFFSSDFVVSQLCDYHRVGPTSPTASPPCAKSCRGGIHSHWDTLRCMTQHSGVFRVQSPTTRGQEATNSSWCGVRRGSYSLSEPLCHQPAACPCPPLHFHPMSNCHRCCKKSVRQCRVCHTNLLWNQSLKCSSPSVSSSVLIGKKASGPHFLIVINLQSIFMTPEISTHIIKILNWAYCWDDNDTKLTVSKVPNAKIFNSSRKNGFGTESNRQPFLRVMLILHFYCL